MTGRGSPGGLTGTGNVEEIGETHASAANFQFSRHKNLLRIKTVSSIESLRGRNMKRRRILTLFAGAALSAPGLLQGQISDPQEHIAWVGQVLKRMLTIRHGMTREQLLTVFTVEGGLYDSLHRTFVSKDCPYFKVDVVFETTGGSVQNDSENAQDRIQTISRPYLQFSVID